MKCLLTVYGTFSKAYTIVRRTFNYKLEKYVIYIYQSKQSFVANLNKVPLSKSWERFKNVLFLEEMRNCLLNPLCRNSSLWSRAFPSIDIVQSMITLWEIRYSYTQHMYYYILELKELLHELTCLCFCYYYLRSIKHVLWWQRDMVMSTFNVPRRLRSPISSCI